MGLYREVRSTAVLRRAWAHIHDNGRLSKCAQTRREVEGFAIRYPTHLQRVARQLREERFRFLPSRGVAVTRAGKRPRPIAIAPLESRIVQRAILDVLQRVGDLLPYLLTPWSFGGIAKQGVPQAIRAAIRATKQGSIYYVRSDIKDFFAAIPRDRVLRSITAHTTADTQFTKLLQEGVRVELANLSELGECAKLFPTHEIGVAQGNCLSVLLGNVLLADFDKLLNGRGITCLRYIDDFIVLGPDRRSVRKAFGSAIKLLRDLGLTAYDPEEEGGKAHEGAVREGFEFLGCRIIPGLIMPARETQERIKAAIEGVFRESERHLARAAAPNFDARRHSVATAVYNARNLVRGWVDQYAFCNDEAFRQNLSTWFNARARRYLSKVETMSSEVAYLRAFGFGLFADGKRVPLDGVHADHVSSDVA